MDVDPALFGLSAIGRALSSGFQLNLTALSITFYNFPLWAVGKLALAGSFGQRSRKAPRLAFQGHKSVLKSLRLLVDSIPALIHSGLPDGSLDFFNQRWLDFVGLPLENLLGWKWTATIHPEDVNEFVEKSRVALAKGEPFEQEARIRRADGEYRWMLHRNVPLRDGQGNTVRWYGSSIDVEDRKQAEERIRQNEKELTKIIDTIPAFIITATPDGSIDFYNQSVLDYTGLSRKELLGPRLDDRNPSRRS